MKDRIVYLEVTYEYKGLEFNEIMTVDNYYKLIEYADIKNVEIFNKYVK